MIPLVIVGGGLAGAMAAIHLARAGRAVVLYERETGPRDKVCGEFLSYEALDALERVGLDPTDLGAEPIDRLTVTVGRFRVAAALPFRALSLSRRVLDEALLAAASDAGAEIRRGSRVTSLETRPGGWRVGTVDGEDETAAQVFLASGKHDLRGHGRPVGRHGDLIGFKTYLKLPEPLACALAGQVGLHLLPGGYAGLEPVEGERFNLCLVVRRSDFAALGRDWGALMGHVSEACPHLAEVLIAGHAEALKPLAVSAIPYGHLQRRTRPGLWRLGDQAAVIPSFAGEGMAMALHSGELASRCYLNGEAAARYQALLARQVGLQVKGATLLSRAMVTPLGHAAAGLGLRLAPGAPALLGRLTRMPRRLSRQSAVDHPRLSP